MKEKTLRTKFKDRETEEWWWGGKSHPTQRFRDYNPDDEKLDDCGWVFDYRKPKMRIRRGKF